MLKISTVTSRLILTGMMVGSCLWFTASRGGLAQDAKQDPAGSLLIVDGPGQTEPAGKKTEASPAAAVIEAPAAELPALDSSVPAAPGRDVPQLTADSPPPGSATPPPGDLASGVNSSPNTLETDDPEKNAQAFVERNRKQAEAQLKTLKDEAERLRARLRKVNSGIKRWEALLGALKQSETVSIVEAPPTLVTPPSRLEPVSPPIKKSAAAPGLAPEAPRDDELVPASSLKQPNPAPPDDSEKPR